jgi:hypothetical protein
MKGLVSLFIYFSFHFILLFLVRFIVFPFVSLFVFLLQLFLHNWFSLLFSNSLLIRHLVPFLVNSLSSSRV